MTVRVAGGGGLISCRLNHLLARERFVVGNYLTHSLCNGMLMLDHPRAAVCSSRLELRSVLQIVEIFTGRMSCLTCDKIYLNPYKWPGK